ncbi:MAG: hypothetical protein WCL44_14625, partial [bacterium]
LKFKTAAIKTIHEAVACFTIKNDLKVEVTHEPDRIPPTVKSACFKYTHHDYGTLHEARDEMAAGQPITVALVTEDNSLIAYAIAERDDRQETDVKIIDVDNYSRREAELSHKLEIEGQEFQVGVGHVLVKAILDNCPPPLYVDSTTPASRYIFKSLGFKEDSSQSNPCILRLEKPSTRK